jgi:hypothetical protein
MSSGDIQRSCCRQQQARNVMASESKTAQAAMPQLGKQPKDLADDFLDFRELC